VLDERALFPIAVLLFPAEFCVKEKTPMAVFPFPELAAVIEL
jgi:hypothetical protein